MSKSKVSALFTLAALNLILACGTAGGSKNQNASADASAKGTDSKNTTVTSATKGTLSLAMPKQNAAKPYLRMEVGLTSLSCYVSGVATGNSGGPNTMLHPISASAASATTGSRQVQNWDPPSGGIPDPMPPMPCGNSYTEFFLASNNSLATLDAIAPGSYQVDVTLLGENDEAIESGSTTVDINPGQQSNADVYLNSVTDCSGSLTVTVHREGDVPPTPVPLPIAQGTGSSTSARGGVLPIGKVDTGVKEGPNVMPDPSLCYPTPIAIPAQATNTAAAKAL